MNSIITMINTYSHVLQLYTSALGALIPTLPLMAFVFVFKRIRRQTPDLTSTHSTCCCNGGNNRITDQTLNDKVKLKVFGHRD